MKEKEADEKANKVSLKAKGSALAKKKVGLLLYIFIHLMLSLCERIYKPHTNRNTYNASRQWNKPKKKNWN
jgi:hypothetical protein